MTRPWLIVGCGYTGTQLARTLAAEPALAAGIVITRRDREVARALGAALGVRGERVDLAETAAAAAAPSSPLVSPGAIVVCSAPPGADPAAEIRALFTLVPDAARIVYLSSTGVYGRGEGAWVDET